MSRLDIAFCNGVYLDSSFRRRFDAPARERLLAAFILGIVVGAALLGVGWLVFEFARRLGG